MFKRIEKTSPDSEFNVSAKRAKLDIPKREPERNGKTREKEHDDLWGDDFVKEDIEEMDFIASEACLQESNTVSNSKHLETGLHSEKTNFMEKPSASNRISQFKVPVPTKKSNLKTMNMQSTSQSTQDLGELNYSQFRNKLMDKKDHYSTFQKGNSIIMSDNSELERLRTENKKLETNFITKDGETVFLRQQLQQIQLRAENEKLETQIKLQTLEIENLQERCKLLESGNIKLKEPQTYANTSLSKNKCNTSITRLICRDIYKKGTSEGFDPMPFLGDIGLCFLMLRYGWMVDDINMKVVNIFGFLVNVAYMAVYYYYTPNTRQLLKQISKVSMFVTVLLAYAQVEDPEVVEHRFGILITILLLLLIASPLAHLKEVIRTKSTELLPFPLIFMGTLVSFQWLLYSVIIDNSFFIFQNVVGFLLSISQLSLFVIFPSKKEPEKRD